MLTLNQRRKLARLKLNDFLSACDLKETPSLKYVDGYKYQSRNDVLIYVGFEVPQNVVTDLVIYRKDGWMLIKKYFAWDGASGPTIDTDATMMASLAHDAGYSLMRQELLALCARVFFDELLERVMVRDRSQGIIGGWFGKVRAKYYRWAVDKFAEKCATPNGAHRVKIAP
jgi:hypothetical protein